SAAAGDKRDLVACGRPVRVSILLLVVRNPGDPAVRLTQVQIVVALPAVAHEHEPVALRRPADAGVVARLLHDLRENERGLYRRAPSRACMKAGLPSSFFGKKSKYSRHARLALFITAGCFVIRYSLWYESGV